MADYDGKGKGVLSQHAERMQEDPAYREAYLTPPSNHPLGGHVDAEQRTADGSPAKQLPSE